MARQTLLDRAIAYVSPRAGLARFFERERLQRAYDAASPRDRWKPRRGGASANADHMADASRLREKSRALVQNVPYIAAGLGALVSHTIGTGIVPRATGADATRINPVFAAWARVCDADGRLDFNGIVAGAYRAMEQDGEVLLRLRPRRAEDGLPVPLQLQLLEIDWLDTTRTQALGANRIINGIEYDMLGAVVAYWLWDSHPGDASTMSALRMQSRRIDARYIVHLFAPERPGQGRGFPRLSSVISRVRDLQLYEDAELARKNLETRLSVLYSGDATQMANPAADGQPVNGNASATGNLGELPSGAITALPTGSNVTVVAPTPAPGYVEYVKQQLHIIAAGFGVTYEMMTGDVSEANFSSARVRLIDFRRGVEQTQALVLVPKLIEPLYRAFIDAGVLGGQFPRADYAMDYSTPKWDYVNPEQDVKADIAEISVGLASISEKLRQRGYRPDEVFAEIAGDYKKLQELGVLDILLFKEAKKPMTDAAAGDAAEAARQAHAAIERVQMGIDALRERSPEINVRAGDVHVEAPKPADVVVNAAPVTVNAPPVSVAVEAPVVNVAPPEVHLPAPPAQPAAMRREVEYDEAGNIKSYVDRVVA